METGSVQNGTPKYPLACYIVGLSLVGYLSIAVIVILIVHLNMVIYLAKASVLRTHILCGAFGMLGASMASIRKYYKYLISHSTALINNKECVPMDWSLGWVYYYLTRPILGAVLGAITFTLSFIGFQILSDAQQIEISGKGKNLLFALAFVSGFSVSHVLDRVDAISRQIFKSSSDVV
ncbi:MAG: hypothetical protein Q7T53_12655 [Deltaproteobacteria bacterium]|nr:hypothetical protein [Deltaproteobacteria bacterium]